jgi:hypothetical protein
MWQRKDAFDLGDAGVVEAIGAGEDWVEGVIDGGCGDWTITIKKLPKLGRRPTQIAFDWVKSRWYTFGA